MPIEPIVFDPGKSTRKIDPHAPRAANAGWFPEPASVSPVGSKKKVLKPEPGRYCAFSGRLNGVAPASFAFRLASNGWVPSTLVSWMSTQVAGHDVPDMCSLSWATENTSWLASAVVGAA